MGRNTILYAAKWTQPGEAKPELISITDEDIHQCDNAHVYSHPGGKDH